MILVWEKIVVFFRLAYLLARKNTAVNCFVVQFIFARVTQKLVMKVIHSRAQTIYIILLPLLGFLFIVQFFLLPGV